MTEAVQFYKMEGLEHSSFPPSVDTSNLLDSNNYINYEDFVVIEYNGRRKCEQILKDKKIKIARNVYVKSEHIQGTLFGRTCYRNSDGSLIEINEKEFFNQLKASIISNQNQPNYNANNQFLLNSSEHNAQKATSEDISKLKSQNVSINELLKYIVEGSSTFMSKNPFSQEKYIRKKLNKHCHIFTVSKPTVQLLAETYYMSSCQKVLSLRPDILGQMVYYSEAAFNSNVLLVENCEGLIAATLFEKLVYYDSIENKYNGGFLMHLDYANKSETCSIFKQLQFKMAVMGSNYQKCPWDQVLPPTSQIYPLVSSRNYHCLVIATRHHNPFEIIEKLYHLILPSSPIVVYHPYREPLTECFVKLKNSSYYCVDLLMTETWSREYQVAPNRTHPLNMMDAGGGYLLRARKIVA